MANEFIHASVSTSLTQAEFEAVGLHVLNSQATGDIIYATSPTQLSRLAVGSTDEVLTTIGGIPVWKPSLENKFNLLSNGSFENGDPPTGWSLYGAGFTVSRSSVQFKLGNYSALLTRNGADGGIYQDYSGWANLVGKEVTFGCWASATVASRTFLEISDGVSSLASSLHTGGGNWELLKVTYTINAGASRVRVVCNIYVGNTLSYFDGAILVEGDSCPSYLSKLIF